MRKSKKTTKRASAAAAAAGPRKDGAAVQSVLCPMCVRVEMAQVMAAYLTDRIQPMNFRHDTDLVETLRVRFGVESHQSLGDVNYVGDFKVCENMASAGVEFAISELTMLAKASASSTRHAKQLGNADYLDMVRNELTLGITHERDAALEDPVTGFRQQVRTFMYDETLTAEVFAWRAKQGSSVHISDVVERFPDIPFLHAVSLKAMSASDARCIQRILVREKSFEELNTRHADGRLSHEQYTRLLQNLTASIEAERLSLNSTPINSLMHSNAYARHLFSPPPKNLLPLAVKATFEKISESAKFVADSMSQFRAFVTAHLPAALDYALNASSSIEAEIKMTILRGKKKFNGDRKSIKFATVPTNIAARMEARKRFRKFIDGVAEMYNKLDAHNIEDFNEQPYFLSIPTDAELEARVVFDSGVGVPPKEVVPAAGCSCGDCHEDDDDTESDEDYIPATDASTSSAAEFTESSDECMSTEAEKFEAPLKPEEDFVRSLDSALKSRIMRTRCGGSKHTRQGEDDMIAFVDALRYLCIYLDRIYTNACQRAAEAHQLLVFCSPWPLGSGAVARYLVAAFTSSLCALPPLHVNSARYAGDDFRYSTTCAFSLQHMSHIMFAVFIMSQLHETVQVSTANFASFAPSMSVLIRSRYEAIGAARTNECDLWMEYFDQLHSTWQYTEHAREKSSAAIKPWGLNIFTPLKGHLEFK
jgi:hypothetical protein